MKEPIRKIHTFADRLREELHDRLNERQIELFRRMEQSTKRMGMLIDDLLAYSHVSRGAAQPERIDLNQKVRQVLEDLEVEVQEKRAHINVGPLPTIDGHRRQLQQLFQNLIGNALKYSRNDRPPEIRIESSTQPGRDIPDEFPGKNPDRLYHLIRVRDNGIGFPGGDAERIFNVFTRLHEKTEYKGTGIGLSIVRKVAENHGGYAWAESVPGEGATFWVALPGG